MKYKNLKETFCFHHIENEQEVYFCNCGKKIDNSNNKANKEELTMSIENNEFYNDVDVMSRFDEVINVVCPKCEKDYSKHKNLQTIIESNKDFFITFELVKKENKIILQKTKVKSSCTLKSRYVRFKEKTSHISVDEKSKKIFFKDYDDKKEKEFNLDSIISVLEKFYFESENLNVIDGLISVHRFLSEMARIVVDSKNMDVVEGLMNQMIGKPGIDVLFKINTIFFGIICYSNLSTIALTKGTVFLFDMMYNCNMPNVSILSDNGVTSPLKIFNFLVTLENKNTQEEINLEKNENSDYVYKSKKLKEKTSKTTPDSKTNKDMQKFYDADFELERWGFNKKEKSAIVKSNGKINVVEDLKIKSVSKYIFNKIETFNDYKKLIKFTKFISYEELVNLVMNHDVKFLIKLFEKIEFRDDINVYSLKQIIPLVLDFVKTGSKVYSFYGEEMKGAEPIKENEDKDLNYESIQRFDFHDYDDSVRMINQLEWDRKKEFDKIKKVNELKEYHDKLLEHYNMINDKLKNEKFINFAEKFKYLEDYDGDYKIKLLYKPKMVLDAAKDMKNCAGSYVTRISNGKYLLLLAYDKSKDKKIKEKERFMIGLNVTQTGLEFEQFKGDCNEKASNRQKETIKKYLEDKDISYREVSDLMILNEDLVRRDFKNLFG